MSRLRLTFACGIYDRMDALRTGEVAVEGIDLNYLAIEWPREIFDRMGGAAEFDAAEFSASEFIGRMARGDRTLVALPVFPSRVFRHSYIYVNRRAGIVTPKQLEGKRVGTALYTQTAAVWISRGARASIRRRSVDDSMGAGRDREGRRPRRPEPAADAAARRHHGEPLRAFAERASGGRRDRRHRGGAAAERETSGRGAAVCRRPGGGAGLFPNHRDFSDHAPGGAAA